MSKPSYERDPERGNGQLEAGVPVGAEVSEGFSGVFFPDDFFAARGFFTGASFAVAGFFAAAFSADLLEGLAFFSGAGFLSDASFLATVLLADAEIFFSGFFSAFLGVFFSGFFSAF